MDSFAEVQGALVTGWSKNGHKVDRPNTTSRKVANNTYLEVREGGTIALRLHSTDIVTFTQDKVILNSGGWLTITTKDRLNKWIPSGVGVYSTKGVWFLYSYLRKQNVCRYFDGLELTYGGNPINPQEPEEEFELAEREKSTKAKIAKYVKGMRAAMPLEYPGPGDCLICQLGTQDMSTEHLESHLEEPYYVPRLAYNALVEKGYRVPQAVYQLQDTDMIGRAVTRYLKARLMPTVAH